MSKPNEILQKYVNLLNNIIETIDDILNNDISDLKEESVSNYVYVLNSGWFQDMEYLRDQAVELKYHYYDENDNQKELEVIVVPDNTIKIWREDGETIRYDKNKKRVIIKKGDTYPVDNIDEAIKLFKTGSFIPFR